MTTSSEVSVSQCYIDKEKYDRDKHRYGHHHNQVDHVYHIPHSSSSDSNHRQQHHHSYFPGFSDFFHNTTFGGSKDDDGALKLPVLHNLERGEDLLIHHSSPGYEINELSDSYQIALDVPGVHLQDLRLQLEQYGHVLHMTGKRQIHFEGELCYAKFEKRFRIGHNIDHDSITAKLSEGILIVTAPKLNQQERRLKDIAIHDGDADLE